MCRIAYSADNKTQYLKILSGVYLNTQDANLGEYLNKNQRERNMRPYLVSKVHKRLRILTQKDYNKYNVYSWNIIEIINGMMNEELRALCNKFDNYKNKRNIIKYILNY